MKIFGLFIAFLSSAALAKPIFESYTEEKTGSWQSVAKTLADLIVSTESDLKQQADEELADKDYTAGDYQQFFASRKISLSSNGSPFLLVRPKSDPYFQTFYGAHTFFHWIVDEQNKILYAGNSDAFRILSSSNNGMKDIQESQCHGGKCYLVKFTFKAGKYEEASCSTQDIDSGKITRGCNLTK
ncbi:Lipoprotein [Chromobacterium violaceum]|uniref:hypothetical protein n=1 Tax=Chromobacterium TaxID=535 RepID=UPI00140BF1D3|nr:hypothetical protein [Chromobacterium vaccinii]MBX9356870.1 hypothetical protein [Chromobacterium vaccinii]NHQ84064.1 hypothetical protein [Chromobacterium vaccinii]